MSGSSSRKAGFAFLAGWIVLLAWRASEPPPAALPASAPDTVFSAERAMGHVEAVAIRPRPPGSAEHRRVATYIEAELAKLGLVPELQRTVAVSRGGGVAGRVTNVIARLPGKAESGRAILLAAHYDGVGAGPSAGDDASGVGVLLETARAILAGPSLEHDVVLLFTDGEEAALLGASAFVKEHRWAGDIDVVLNVDARGTRGRVIMFRTAGGDGDLVRLLRRVGDIETTSLWGPLFDVAGGDTDLSEFRDLDRPGLDFAFVDGYDRYHTAEDDVAHLDPRSVQHHGDQALGLIRLIGRDPLPRPPSTNATYFELPGLGLVIYSSRWNGLLGAISIGLALLLVARRRRREPAAIKGALIGMSVCLIAVVTGWCLAFLAVVTAPAAGTDPGVRNVAAVAIVLVTVAGTVGWWRFGRRFAAATDLRVGAALLWALLAGLAAWIAPGGSFLFGWPALVVLAAEHWTLGRPSWSLGVRWIAHLVALGVVIPAAYPTIVLLGVVDAGSLLIGAGAPLLLWLGGNPLESLAGARWRRSAGLVTGAALCIWVAIAVWPAAPKVLARERLAYAVDVIGRRGWPVAPKPEAGGWMDRALGAGALPPGQPDEATRPRWLERVMPRRFSVLVGAESAWTRSGPTATVIRDSIAASRRLVTVKVEGLEGMLDVSLNADRPASFAAVDGRALEPRQLGGRRPWSLLFVAPADSGLVVDLELAPDAGTIEIWARSADLPPEVAGQLPARGAGAPPIQLATVHFQRLRLGGLPEQKSGAGGSVGKEADQGLE